MSLRFYPRGSSGSRQPWCRHNPPEDQEDAATKRSMPSACPAQGPSHSAGKPSPTASLVRLADPTGISGGLDNQTLAAHLEVDFWANARCGQSGYSSLILRPALRPTQVSITGDPMIRFSLASDECISYSSLARLSAQGVQRAS